MYIVTSKMQCLKKKIPVNTVLCLRDTSNYLSTQITYLNENALSGPKYESIQLIQQVS